MKGEDKFLWWQRRAMIFGALVILAWGAFERPMLLIMTPALLIAIAVPAGRILRDRRAMTRTAMERDDARS